MNNHDNHGKKILLAAILATCAPLAFAQSSAGTSTPASGNAESTMHSNSSALPGSNPRDNASGATDSSTGTKESAHTSNRAGTMNNSLTPAEASKAAEGTRDMENSSGASKTKKGSANEMPPASQPYQQDSGSK